MSSLSQKYEESLSSNNIDSFSNISVRVSLETASLIETVSIVTQQAVLRLFTEDISIYLAEYLCKDDRNIDVIKAVLNEESESLNVVVLESHIKTSAIGKLIEDDVVSINYDYGFTLKK